MSLKYELIICWSNDDQSFIVDIPELPGCMADGSYSQQSAPWRAISENSRRTRGYPKAAAC